MLDEQYRARFKEAERVAQATGRDLLETLDALGLLATPQVRHRVQVDTLKDLYLRIEEQGATRIHAFAGFTSGTPDTMFRAVLEWLETVYRATAEKKI